MRLDVRHMSTLDGQNGYTNNSISVSVRVSVSVIDNNNNMYVLYGAYIHSVHNFTKTTI